MKLDKYKKILVVTGAGVSAESGVPTFRGGGESAVWKGLPFEVISSADMVRTDLDAVWEWFDFRRSKFRECVPNPAHDAIALLEQKCEEFLLVTQNIDGLHQIAGSERVIELHGSINRVSCIECNAKMDLIPEKVPHEPNKCTKCGAKVRPDVVLFGEMLPVGVFETALDFAIDADLCLVVGTSALVYPAAAIPEAAAQNGARLIEINPEPTPLSPYCDEVYREPAGKILPQLVSS